MKNGTAKVQFSCQHEFQDKTYGSQTRVANATAKQTDKAVDVRWTVCNKTQTISSDKVK